MYVRKLSIFTLIFAKLTISGLQSKVDIVSFIDCIPKMHLALHCYNRPTYLITLVLRLTSLVEKVHYIRNLVPDLQRSPIYSYCVYIVIILRNGQTL